MKELSGIERCLKAINFEQTDYVPVVGGFIRHPAFLAQVAGVSVKQFWENPRKTALEAFKRLNADMILGLILPQADNEVCAEVNITHGQKFYSPEDVRDYADSIPDPEYTKREFDFDQVYQEHAIAQA